VDPARTQGIKRSDKKIEKPLGHRILYGRRERALRIRRHPPGPSILSIEARSRKKMQTARGGTVIEHSARTEHLRESLRGIKRRSGVEQYGSGRDFDVSLLESVDQSPIVPGQRRAMPCPQRGVVIVLHSDKSPRESRPGKRVDSLGRQRTRPQLDAETNPQFPPDDSLGKGKRPFLGKKGRPKKVVVDEIEGDRPVFAIKRFQLFNDIFRRTTAPRLAGGTGHAGHTTVRAGTRASPGTLNIHYAAASENFLRRIPGGPGKTVKIVR